MTKRIVVGITGASGVIYGVRLLEMCRDLGLETHLIISEWGKKNIELETDYSVEEVIGYASRYYDINNLAAPVSSGSFNHDGMVIIPCSMKTLGALSASFDANLIIRAADVTIKEGRQLTIIPRETPFHSIHLENMLKLARMGTVIFPPVPSMYARPKSLVEMIDHTVGRVLHRMGIMNQHYHRWGETEEAQE